MTVKAVQLLGQTQVPLVSSFPQVYFATTGFVPAPGFVLGGPTRLTSVNLPGVVAICVRTDGSIWLIDAGWSAEVCSEPRHLGWMRHTLRPRVSAGDDIASQLTRAGLDPSNVTTIIATHLHLDHVGGVADFPNAELIAPTTELTSAYQTSWRKGYRKDELDRLSRLRLVEFRKEPCLGFKQSLALSDDVVLLDARGHTAGHVAVLIRAQEHTWLHAGDAAYSEHELVQSSPSLLMRMVAHDLRQQRQTLASIRASQATAARPRVVFSHDPEAFKTLPKLAGVTAP